MHFGCGFGSIRTSLPVIRERVTLTGAVVSLNRPRESFTRVIVAHDLLTRETDAFPCHACSCSRKGYPPGRQVRRLRGSSATRRPSMRNTRIRQRHNPMDHRQRPHGSSITIPWIANNDPTGHHQRSHGHRQRPHAPSTTTRWISIKSPSSLGEKDTRRGVTSALLFNDDHVDC
jgi:hypothetical protein